MGERPPDAPGGETSGAAASQPEGLAGEGGMPPAGGLPAGSARAPAPGPVDVAVVGAGLAGLTTAALLARAGRRVLLLEQAAEAGGVCRPLRRGAAAYETGPGLLLPPRGTAPVRLLAERLGIALPVRPLEPLVQIALPGHRLTLAGDPEQWPDELRREAPGEEAGWQALWEELGAIQTAREELIRELPLRRPEGWGERLRAWRMLTFGERGLRAALAEPFPAALARHAVGPVARRALEALLWQTLLRGAGECSTAEAAGALGPWAAGAAGPAAAVPGLIEALQARVLADGGSVRLGTGVSRLLVERGRVGGVVLADGETVQARQVVAAVSPLDLAALLPAGRGWRRRPPLDGAWRPSHLAQMLLVAVPEAYVPSELGEHAVIVADDAQPVQDANAVCLRAGRPADGQDARRLCLSRFIPAPAEEPFETALLQALDSVIPGVAEVATDREALAPARIAGHWGRREAAVRYVADPPAWLGQRGAGPRLGWPGLWVVGEWTFPGRPMPRVIAGAMAVADRLLEEL